jgi:hypothetical protein
MFFATAPSTPLARRCFHMYEQKLGVHALSPYLKVPTVYQMPNDQLHNVKQALSANSIYKMASLATRI